MPLAIPHAPRPVRLAQVPGAVRRLVVAVGVGLFLCAALTGGAERAARWFSEERAFLAKAQEVPATVARVRLPPKEAREREDAELDVLYAFAGLQRSVSGVRASALWAAGVGQGAEVTVLVDPAEPERPREAGWARARAGLLWLLPAAVALGVLLGASVVGWQLRRVYRREVNPLRVGALVWLTPDGELPRTRQEIRFGARYLRAEAWQKVRVRGRPGRAPVRNGEKLLGAVVPGEPGWARLVDEDLARTLGWLR